VTVSSTPAAPTVGEIARRLGVPLHRVEYLIRARGIRPASRAGNARVFAEADIKLIAGELSRSDSGNIRSKEAPR
jgi:DNA-binding transcriptional MerR regulator